MKQWTLMSGVILVVGLVCCFACSASFAAELIFVRNAEDSPIIQQQIALATQFYGVEIRTITLRRESDSNEALRWLQNRDTVGAAITPSALAIAPRSRVLAALRRPKREGIPLLIVGITPKADSRLLLTWSNGTIKACQDLGAERPSASYVFGSVTNVTRQLGDQEIETLSPPTCSLLAQPAEVDVLMSVRRRKRLEPVFVRTAISPENVFFVVGTRPTVLSQAPALSLRSVFSEIAPMMMFVHYAAGEHAWHSVGHYANLSIDDPWLIEPYGHLNYESLLAEMERHNFHSTIAFIPWNFDRSQAQVAALFRAHPDRLSISIHGNNHDHAEFSDYTTVPLNRQVANIEQAIARMEKFNDITGIPYDRVMVFPHTTGPESTLAELKKYGFLATAYSLDLPLGVARPSNPLFFLRTFDLDFANLTGLKRYSVEVGVSRAELAVNAFLDNPILFYGHEKIFNNGINAFDELADTVNVLQPDSRWCSLGCVAQHLYLVKLREDGEVDAEIFSSDVLLENRNRQDKVFFVKKDENFMPPITSVTVGGQVHPFGRSGTYLTLNVFVPAGESRSIRVHYLNDWVVAGTEVGKKGIRIALLRKISDFRDMTLSRSSWGRAITRFYYQESIDSFELRCERMFFVVVATVVLVAVVLTAARVVRDRNLTLDGRHGPCGPGERE